MNKYRSTPSKRRIRRLGYLAGILASTLPIVAEAATVANPLCPAETVLFNPGSGEDIVVPPGFRVSGLGLRHRAELPDRDCVSPEG